MALKAAANRSCRRYDKESRWTVVPTRPRVHCVPFTKDVQRKGDASENQQQIDQRTCAQIKRVLEGPSKQQNHSDNYEHLELPITPETDVRTYTAPGNRSDANSFCA